jgi:outer membrane protein TolC
MKFLNAPAFVLASLSLSATAQKTDLVFKALPKLVKERNDHAKGSEKLYQAAEAQRPSFVQPFMPVLKAEAGAEAFRREVLPPRQDPFWGVTAELNLFRGGKDYLARRAAGLEADAAKLAARQSYLEELTKTRVAYAELVYAESLKRVLLEAKSLNEKNLHSASRRRASGLATDTDQIEFEIKRQAIEQDLAATELEIAQQRSALSVLLGFDLRAPQSVNWPQSFEDITFDRSRVSVQDIESVALQFEKIETERKQAESLIAARWWVPDVDAYAGYAVKTMRESDEYRRRDRRETYAGVRASLVFFDGGEGLRKSRYEARVAEAQALKLAQSRRENESELEISLRSIEKNEKLREGAEKSARSSKRYLTQTLAEYARGAKNSPDVSSATDKYIEAETRFLAVQKDYLIALSQLFAVLGPEIAENN